MFLHQMPSNTSPTFLKNLLNRLSIEQGVLEHIGDYKTRLHTKNIPRILTGTRIGGHGSYQPPGTPSTLQDLGKSKIRIQTNP